MMSKVEVMDLTVVCRSFPVSPHPEIHREHFLDTIDKIFEAPRCFKWVKLDLLTAKMIVGYAL